MSSSPKSLKALDDFLGTDLRSGVCRDQSSRVNFAPDTQSLILPAAPEPVILSKSHHLSSIIRVSPENSRTTERPRRLGTNRIFRDSRLLSGSGKTQALAVTARRPVDEWWLLNPLTRLLTPLTRLLNPLTRLLTRLLNPLTRLLNPLTRLLTPLTRRLTRRLHLHEQLLDTATVPLLLIVHFMYIPPLCTRPPARMRVF